MKKSLSIILSTLTLASALTACAPAADRLDPAITLASSDAAAKAEWLADRLDVIPDDVVIGIGSNSAYGIDMTTFEDDGYIDRAIGGEVLLFGKTADSLDRAVREYAKAADIGATAELDTVYHEGERIKKLTIAGNDISEYTVVFNYDREVKNPFRSGMTLGNAKFAAEELVRLIEVATGVTLSTSPEDVAGPMFKIDYIEDDSLDTNGFTYKVENGNVYLNGAKKAHGCANGVYYFLETELDWDGLTIGDSELQPAEHIDVPEGASATVDPMFDYFVQSQSTYNIADPFDNERDPVVLSTGRTFHYLGYIQEANHGMQLLEWSDYSSAEVAKQQICHTSNANYETVFDSVWSYVNKKIDSGSVIGEDITTIDISQGDNFYYCICSDCQKVFRDENKAHSGAVVRFANRLAEDMEAEGFGGLTYQIYAYWNSNKPCKTAPRSDVYVTYCTDRACIIHPMDGSECYGASFGPGMSGGIPDTDFVNNNDYAEWLRGWDELTDGNLMVYHYAIDNNFGQYTYFTNFYKDIMFFKENGASSFYFHTQIRYLGLSRLRASLIGFLQFHPETTETEYEIALEEIMRSEYGDGWDFVKDFIHIWKSTETNDCVNCWAWDDKLCLNNYIPELYSAKADEMYDLLEKAILQANTEAQEKRIQRLQLEVAYRQCATTYFKAYDADDTDTIAHLEERYAKFVELCASAGHDIDAFPAGAGKNTWKMGHTLEEEMWGNLLSYRDELTPEGSEQKPMPDVWAQWYETSSEDTTAS